MLVRLTGSAEQRSASFLSESCSGRRSFKMRASYAAFVVVCICDYYWCIDALHRGSLFGPFIPSQVFERDRRSSPIRHSAYGFCHGDRGDISRSRIPITRNVPPEGL